jgi:hypothetical protein
MALWVAIPVAWLWIGSQVEANADIATGLGVAMAGSILSIIVAVVLLARLNSRHLELQRRRKGDDHAQTSVLELMLVVTAAVAVVIFGVWFLLFAGTSPAPLNISY